MKTIVLDSYALMAFFENEKGADCVRNYLIRALHGEVTILMNVVNLGEVWYAIARTNSPKTADQYLEKIMGLSIEILDINWPIAYQAAVFKAQGNISYADCFAAALAKDRQGTLLTGDSEFQNLEHEINVEWI